MIRSLARRGRTPQNPRPTAQSLAWQPLPVLPRDFYARPTIDVARGLLGQIVVNEGRAGRIVEVEAYVPHYQGEPDLAAHSARGLTGRTKVIFGPPGHAYVYLIYGMYECLNVVAEPEGIPGCVLIRAVEPLGELAPADGPGKLTRALGITRAHYGHDLLQQPLTIRDNGIPAEPVLASPRIGIRHCAEWPLRFTLAGNPHLSRPR
jgi:DNA-3-methyladenine glycosylase